MTSQIRLLSWMLALSPLLVGQQSISIEEYDPKSTLVVPEHIIKRAKYPFIDVHNHQRDVSQGHVEQLLRDMESLNMRILIDSPVMGGWGEFVRRATESFRKNGQGRFAVMTNIRFEHMDDPDYGKRAAEQLETDIRNGAIGLKVWQNFGQTEKDAKGRIHVDDPRFDAVWDVCARNRIPVLIHTGLPKALSDPMDAHNERWLELKLHPERKPKPGDPSWEELIGEQHRLFELHPKTSFIAAHMGWMGNDLGALGELLDRLPNVNVEIGAITSELGRQPRMARAFFLKYQDRVLFGKDHYSVPEYWTCFRLLETADEYFDPIRKYHGIWKLYGLDLPDEVLKKLYYKNALRLFPTLDRSGFPD